MHLHWLNASSAPLQVKCSQTFVQSTFSLEMMLFGLHKQLHMTVYLFLLYFILIFLSPSLSRPANHSSQGAKLRLSVGDRTLHSCRSTCPPFVKKNDPPFFSLLSLKKKNKCSDEKNNKMQGENILSPPSQILIASKRFFSHLKKMCTCEGVD